MMNDQIAHMNAARTTDSAEKLQPDDMYQMAGDIARAVKSFEMDLRDDLKDIWENRRSGRISITHASRHLAIA
jgi:hypothetical protein